ncbi:MAG: recombinase family protein [Pirellulales bacterium]|nr:recombinase family protein [Pirellulales bacterium]
MKRFVALARVSSREQEREGFSLAVQEDALKRFAISAGGEIAKLYRIAETASKRDERKTFREMIAYAKKHARELDGLLFYKIDRAARNLFDYVELERLESDYGLVFFSVSQPTENTPAGRMMRRTLANMASFYTEQQSLDVREGLARRVEEGWFIGKAPFGYKNVRREGRGIVEVDPENAPKVKRIFELYAFHNLTLDSLKARLAKDGIVYKPSMPGFVRGKLYEILKDRAYIGEIEHRGKWFTGRHEPIVDFGTWRRVQILLGGKTYQRHQLTFGSELVRCGHCNHPVTGEIKTKQTKTGERQYIYYRCTRYTSPGHPRTRTTEQELDRQILELFDRIKIQDPAVRDWFVDVLKAKTHDDGQASIERRQELQRQVTLAVNQRSRLVDLRMNDEIDEETFADKRLELADRIADLKLNLDAIDRGQEEMTDLALKVFELSQTLRDKWLTAEPDVRRKILEIVCLNYSLLDGKLCYEIRKPFDVLAEGLDLAKSRGDRI